jgi:hypothetical protein
LRLRVALALIAIAPSLPAQGAKGAAPVHRDASELPRFRTGLEVSVEGSPWGHARTVALSPSRCRPATTSPCAPGTPAVIVNVRFPAVTGAVDMAQVRATLGEAGGAGNYYDIRPVPSNAVGTICAGGMIMSAPFSNMRMAINIGNPGTPLPVTCRWTVLVGIPGPRGTVELVWSDTVTVQLVAQP